ncbi:MAG: sigma-70 family RNA polymerase sigma factor [Clostridia bacterium]|nr:sigma-70 family RNA polymerase sigma factor [Clostridia bacterium]
MENKTKEMDSALATLILNAKQEQPGAFEELLERYTPLIESMTAQFAPSSCPVQDREDLRQEAVLGFYRALQDFDLDQREVQFGLYAKLCIRNRLISYLRTLKRHAVVSLPEEEAEIREDSEQDPANRVMENEAYMALYERIRNALSPYENRVWWLYMSGRTAGEIAAKVGREERSVQNAIYRIRRKLRSIIPYS